jgi:hypothetical protein
MHPAKKDELLEKEKFRYNDKFLVAARNTNTTKTSLEIKLPQKRCLQKGKQCTSAVIA